MKKKKETKEKGLLFKNVKTTWKYFKSARKYLIGYGMVSVIEAIIGAILPLFSAKIILNLTDGVIDQLIYSALVVLGIDIILYIEIFFKGFFYQKVYLKTLIDIQKDLAREILKLEIKEIDKNSSGMFIDRLNKDTADLAGLFMEYTYWLTNILSNVGVLVTVLILNRYLFVYAIATSIVVYLINRKSLSKQYSSQKILKKLSEEKTSLTSELVRGMRDIKVLNASDTILNQTTKKIEATVKEQIHIMNIRRLYNYLTGNIRALTDFGFIVIGVILYKYKLLTIPVFLIVYNYQNKIKNLLNGVVEITEFNKKFEVASERVYEVIENNTFEKETFGDKEIEKLSGNIKFKNVSFGYDKNRTIIRNMNFEIKPNERVAFVGKSGAGKSTIFSLITRLYKINKGSILFDDNNLNELTCSSLRDNMSIITQSPYIFNFSIKDNLLLAKEDATMKEIREACKLACIDDYIMSLPNKYNTMVGENGIILSGGQKQRLAIARALLMKTKIILFDEATSALDNETQSKIQEAINNLQGEYTIIIVAHRLSTVIDSDRIFVVDDGKIVGEGSHKQLLKNCDYYKNLYNKDLVN